MFVRRIIFSVVVVLILIQFYPVDTINPKETAPIQMADSVSSLIENACYDCHSNNTKWPWYTNIAPISWFLLDHVNEGRRELNFSEWNSYSVPRMKRKLQEIVEEVEQDKMPLKDYKMMHPEAELLPKDKEKLIRWAKAYADSLVIHSNE